MDIVQRRGGAAQPLRQGLGPQPDAPSLRTQAIAQTAAREELQNGEGNALVLADVENLDDVGMVEAGQVAGLALEAGGKVALLEHGEPWHLDDDIAIEERIVSAVDVGHAALAEFLLHVVAAVGERQ